jgi:hypothetical protein
MSDELSQGKSSGRRGRKAGSHKEADGLTERQVHQRVNSDLRAWWSSQGKPGLRASFMSHAAKVNGLWPGLFGFKTKKLPYQHYRQMAVCRLEPDQKQRLRTWAEKHQPQ